MQPTSALIAPDWLDRAQMPATCEPAILHWLFHQDSLTRRLSRLSADHFSITVLFEGWQLLRDDECVALSLRAGAEGWVREVHLHGHGQNWVFARSVASRDALLASGLNMGELGTRSLGLLLFSDPAFDRGELQACRYPAQWLPVEDRAEGRWGRRSCFSRGGLGVLVAEIFLPDLLRAIKNAEPF